jgi:hypothetical protein
LKPLPEAKAWQKYVCTSAAPNRISLRREWVDGQVYSGLAGRSLQSPILAGPPVPYSDFPYTRRSMELIGDWKTRQTAIF